MKSNRLARLSMCVGSLAVISGAVSFSLLTRRVDHAYVPATGRDLGLYYRLGLTFVSAFNSSVVSGSRI